jgi:hypothetical protein
MPNIKLDNPELVMRMEDQLITLIRATAALEEQYIVMAKTLAELTARVNLLSRMASKNA